MSAGIPAAPAAPITTDAVVIGAGPAGLFQAFELGLLEVRSHVIDSLPFPGGQCVELYGDKPIYDIPGVPYCTGQQLTDQLLQQLAPIQPGLHYGQVVTALQPLDDGSFHLQTDRGLAFHAKVVIVAGGVGAFLPRKLKVDGLERHEGTQVLYHRAEPQACAGAQVIVVGGGNEAIEAALDLASEGPHQAARVTLVHRRDAFQADAELVRRLNDMRSQGRVHFLPGQVTGEVTEPTGGDLLTQVQVTDVDGVVHLLPVDRLLVYFGLSPRLGPIADWGLGIERKQIVVDTEKFETNVPGIYAVGDINTYPGKKKLILCGFHEATLAAFAAAARVYPGERIPLQYTTTSPQLHRVLGVAPPPDTVA